MRYPALQPTEACRALQARWRSSPASGEPPSTKERSKLEHDLADRLTEIRLLKDRLAALTTTVEHLVRDNRALRQMLTRQGAIVSYIEHRHRKESE